MTGLRRLAIVAALMVAAAVLGGCEYLLGYGQAFPAPDGSFDPEAPFGTPTATYRTGTGSIKIGDQTVTLDGLASPGTLFTELGADVAWAGADGWYLRLSGAMPNSGSFGPTAYISLDRVTGGRHWMTWDPMGCGITLDHVDVSGVSGSATCKGMRWADAIGGGISGTPSYIEGEAPFDAEITFSAKP